LLPLLLWASVILAGSLFRFQLVAAEDCVEPDFSAAARVFSVGNTPQSVAVRDFNGDTKLDLAVADFGSTNLFVLLGKGDGRFRTILTNSLSSAAYSIVAGDFNNDNIADLATAGLSGAQVLLGNGNGTFRRTATVGVPSMAWSVDVSDFDGDGNLDLALADSFEMQGLGNVSVALGKGDGTFQAFRRYSTGAGSAAVAVADFNRDAKPDLAIANFASHNVSVLLGKGDGTFESVVNYGAWGPSGPRSLAVGDFNGDESPDIAVKLDGGAVPVLLSRADGTFYPGIGGGSAVGVSIAVGDFNRDDKSDLVVASGNTYRGGLAKYGFVSILLGNGDGAFQAPVQCDVGPVPRFSAVGDFDGNNKLDLAVAGSDSDFDNASGSIWVLRGTGDGSFQTANNYDAEPNAHGIAMADFNDDGRLDLAVANRSCPGCSPVLLGSVSVILGNGDGSFQATANYQAGTGPTYAVAGDLNLDGKPDLIVANEGLVQNNYTNGSLSVLLGKGDGTFLPATNHSAGSAPYFVSVADFNLDGKPDVAVANVVSPGTVSVLLGKGDGGFLGATGYAVGDHPLSVVVNDFNGDTKPDLAVANSSSANVSVLLGNGDGTFQTAVNYAAGSDSKSVATGDFNADGKADVAVANRSTVSVLLGGGDGTFEGSVNYAVGTAAGSLAVGEFNGDRTPDLAVVSRNPGYISFLLGKGDGTFDTAVNFGAGTYPGSLAVGDANGDGKLDVVVANAGSNGAFGGVPSVRGTVSVLLNTCVCVGIDIAFSATSVKVSWPLPSTGFVLESTTSLSPPSWQPASELPVTNNARLEITVSPDVQGRYFRLRKP
jgi:VCBS repeat protein/FG-GAP repeat protein